MLVLTPAAIAVVTTLTNAPGRPDGTGLRISSDQAPPQESLAAEIVAQPGERDQVLDQSGARIFLDPGAASFLDDKVLDADVDERGGAHFTLDRQDDTPAL